MDAAEIVAGAFPIASERASLELVEVHPRDGGALTIVVRIIIWDVDGEARSIRDVKEQEVYCLGPGQGDDPRLAACVTGWRDAVELIFRQEDDHGGERLETLLPHELICFAGMLGLRRATGADDFTDAALKSRKRLGRLWRDG